MEGMKKEELEQMNKEILILVNAAAQIHCSKNESQRLLEMAREIASIRNRKMDKSFDLMNKFFNPQEGSNT
jgi:hypothetical protein